MKKEECKKKILEKLNGRDLLEQLAEESAELTQAALKTVRAAGYTENETPVSLREAVNNLLEEILDVALVIDVVADLDMVMIANEKNEKWQRWVKRLEESDG